MKKDQKGPRPKRGGQRVSPQTIVTAEQLNDLNFWRALAQLTNPKVTDEIERGEIAMAFRGVAQQVATHWADFSKIVNKTDEKMGGLGLSIKLDRRTEPGEVSVVSSYSEKHGSTVKGRVPDPKVMELDFNETQPPKDDDSGGEPEEEKGKGEQQELSNGD